MFILCLDLMTLHAESRLVHSLLEGNCGTYQLRKKIEIRLSSVQGPRHKASSK